MNIVVGSFVFHCRENGSQIFSLKGVHLFQSSLDEWKAGP